uniref:hypothetical protein n=1 Tax=Aerococcus urinaeequi TaxID=51665 RepID=UPI00352A8769
MTEMALTNRREKKPRPIVENVGDTSRVHTGSETPIQESKPRKQLYKRTDEATIDFNQTFSSKDRKTIKVDPDIKNLVEIFSNLDGTKDYETVKRMAKFYFDNNYDERTQRIISSLHSNKYIG